jgi:ubiquinone/menaquinone biosynthesis C-methylase UbiE
MATTSATAPERDLAPGANAEAIEAWDGPLYERFVRFRHLLTEGLGAHGEEALRLLAPRVGERALDIGCGFGDTTLRLAQLVGVSGRAVGVDASPRFIQSARTEARQAGVGNVDFSVADVQTAEFEQGFDVAFSRFGTMFFANPVAAMRNVVASLVPGGRFAMVVWRAKTANEWVYRAQQITERFVSKPEQYDEPTCGPGPFSMANADTTSEILLSAGLERVSLHRCDLPIKIGEDLDEAVEFVMSLGPAGEILRLAGERAVHLHAPVAQALRDQLAEWQSPRGVIAPASSWVVTASVSPGAHERAQS